MRVSLPPLRGASWEFIQDMRRTGGKAFRADTQLIPREESCEFPACPLEHADGQEADVSRLAGRHRATLMVAIAREHGERMAGSWLDPFVRQLCSDGNERACALLLSITEGWPAKVPFLRRLLRTGSRREGAETLFCFSDGEALRKDIGPSNPLSASAMILDGEGLIRWRGSGEADEEEVGSMLQCARSLLSHSSISTHYPSQ